MRDEIEIVVGRRSRGVHLSKGSERVVAFFLLALSACSGIRTSEEFSARERLEAVSTVYRPDGQRPDSPVPKPESTLFELVHFAVLNSPAAQAAYFDWAQAIERITVERSFPDPRLTFEADIEDVVMALMPGLMVEIPGPGKLGAMTAIAAGEADVKLARFRKAVIQAAAALKIAYYELQALDDGLAVNRRNLELVRELRELAGVQHGAGKVTLQDVLRADIEDDDVRVRIENLEDSRSVVAARYRAALGMPGVAGTVSLPASYVNTSEVPDLDQVYAVALERNPDLAEMESEIRRAEAAVTLARLSAVPDFSIGLEVDVKPNKPIITPDLSVSLPIWRDKIAAEIQSATAAKKAADARLEQSRLMLAVEFAAMAFMFRESEREYRLYTERLIPSAQSSLDVVRSGYVGGQSSFIDFLEAERSLLQFELSRIEARKNRERALANLSLTIAGVSPVAGLDAETRDGKGGS